MEPLFVVSLMLGLLATGYLWRRDHHAQRRGLSPRRERNQRTLPVKERPSDSKVLSNARFWGARDIDHPLIAPRTYDSLLETCGVYPVHGGPACVKHVEEQIRTAYGVYGARLADD